MSVRIQSCFVFLSIQCVRLETKAAPAHESNINVASRSNDSHRLIVHECSGLEPGDARGLKAIRDFLSDRAILGYATPGGLHAVW